jgi:hypothetical protein
MRLKSILTIIVLAGIVALLIWAFIEGRRELAMEQERERPVKSASRVSIQDGESIVTLDSATQMKSGITTTPLEPVSHHGELRAYGMVLSPQDLVDLRDRYAAAKARLEKAQAGLEVSGKAYERLKVLRENNRNISEKALQAAEATWRSNEAEARAAEEALRVLEDNARQQWGGVIAGWLLDGSPALDRLMQQQDVLIQITLPSGARVPSAPQTARVQAADGTLTSITLVSPSLRTDPRIQGISFFYTAPAQVTSLLPGMNVIAYLPVGPKISGIIVPDSAVVWWQGKAWVYVQKDTDRFARREISTDQPVQNGWFIGKGFSAGDRLVTSGAQLLLSEELRAQIQVGEEGK